MTAKLEKNRNLKRAGFTLVELLIVIALIGVLVLVVLAAINPIEQVNKARDTRFRSDGAQLLAAIDRYFTSQSEFTWVTVDSTTYSNDTALGYMTAANQLVGVCGATCSADGVLITNLELKESFRGRDFLTATTDNKRIHVGKEAGASASAYACFYPQSKSIRDKAIAGGKVYTLSMTGNGERTVTSTCDSTWTTSCYICVPE
ncbi:prepilin-type N-terminal cleavage/methylation domain-containing protein [Patescibacteria group bacterium]|nr:prepilin-type N-terminal cleavage/methylation domain-containing protein [Patescibacteria group bacterium]